MSNLPAADNVLGQIDLQDPRVTELEAISLAKMLQKREQYIRQGRFDCAHGVGTAAWILWTTLTNGRQFLTGWGEL